MPQFVTAVWCPECKEHHAWITCIHCKSHITIFRLIPYQPFTHMCPHCRKVETYEVKAA